MILPSKELYISVTGCKNKFDATDYQKEGVVEIYEYIDSTKTIQMSIFCESKVNSDVGCYKPVNFNIYELMHLMKEWLLNNGLDIEIVLFASGGISISMGDTFFETFNETSIDSEFAVVLAACEWILEQQK